MHTPAKEYFLSPQKPIIQSTDRAACSEFFDIRLSTDVSRRCSDTLEDEYKVHMKNMRVNSSLQAVLGEDYLKFIKSLFDINMSNFSKEIFNLDHAFDNPFIEFLKQSYNDLCVCWNDPRDYSQGGERTLFSEVFIQQFKLFSKMTKLLQFKWVEKKMNNTDHTWLVKKDFVKKEVQLKLLDGIGIMKKNNINFIMLESSG
jgi:hypothetical protein